MAGALWAWHAWQYRWVKSNADLVRYLPPGGGTTGFVDLEAVRAAGWGTLIGQPGAHWNDSDYRSFVKATGFDFTRDVDAIAFRTGSASTLLMRGQFAWPKLERYAKEQGGSCEGDVCRVRTRSQNKEVAFSRIQPDVLALSLAGRVMLPAGLQRVSSTKPAGPSGPVWVVLGNDALASIESWPVPLRNFASLLAAGQQPTFDLAPANATSEAAFVLELAVKYPSQVAAKSVHTRLELQTKMAALELAREHQNPNPGDLTGLLTAGSFEAVGDEVRGVWPVRRELLESLTR